MGNYPGGFLFFKRKVFIIEIRIETIPYNKNFKSSTWWVCIVIYRQNLDNSTEQWLELLHDNAVFKDNYIALMKTKHAAVTLIDGLTSGTSAFLSHMHLSFAI